MNLKWVGVFCGSSPGLRGDYAQAAVTLGRELAARGLGLMYGGGNVGLMGIVADATLAAGGRVVGVIPEALQAKELAHLELTELHVVRSMHERKAMMAERSDAFIAMPGGFGTLEEICEVITWNQLGYLRKPTGLLNIAGFYDPLMAMIDHAVTERFIKPEHRAMVLIEQSPGALLDAFADYRAPVMDKWIDRRTS